MQPQFIRNLDSGMRRLGYLEVLICDCIKKGEQTADKYLGEALGEWAEKNQLEFLESLGKRRKLKGKEVGKITERTASRYVKYATEIGLLTKGPEKELTDMGRLFQSYRNNVFLIEKNPGQQILMLDSLLTKDKIIFTKLIRKLSNAKILEKMEIFSWFANECIPEILNEIKEYGDEDLVRRLKDTRKNYLGNRSEKKRGYDLIKHMIDTRIENLVDLGIIKKTPEKKYMANDFTHIINDGLKNFKGKEIIHYCISRYFNSTKKLTNTQLIKNYIKQYDDLANYPIESVYLPTLYMCLLIDSAVSQKSTFTIDMIENLEEILFKKHYGDVVFLRDRDGTVTHINIDEKVKEKMREGRI